ncbi:MAG: ABC transporter substrate-binding protein [Thiobacillus sp.]|nr:ABC transporter substrate-binding protein [Thiobacillus sp.]
MLATLIIGGVALWVLRTPVSPLSPLSPVTIAVPTQINSALAIIATSQGLFQKADVNVISKPFLLGKDALKSVIDGQADLALVADTALMFSLHNGNKLDIVASISQGRRSLAIVTRNDRGINTLQDLRGKSVAVTMGTNFTYFIDMILQVQGVPSSEINFVDLNTADTLTEFKAGRIDAAVVFQPYLAQLETELGNQIQVFYGDDVYAFRFMLVGKPLYIERHPEEIKRVLRALVAAEKLVRDHPATARKAVGNAINIDDALMAKLFNPEDYAISLDQAMLLAFDDQTRWAMRRGIIARGPIPNYLENVKYQYLEAILPSAVKVVR